MRPGKPFCAAIAAMALLPASAGAQATACDVVTSIDDFSLDQGPVTDTTDDGVSVSSSVAAGFPVVDGRRIAAESFEDEEPTTAQVADGGFTGTGTAAGRTDLIYQDPQFTAIDLTSTGADSLAFDATLLPGSSLIVFVVDQDGGVSSFSTTSSGHFDVPFSSFVQIGPSPADFQNVSFVSFTISESIDFGGTIDNFGLSDCMYDEAALRSRGTADWVFPLTGSPARVRVTLVRRTPAGRYRRWTGGRWARSSRRTRAAFVTTQAKLGRRMPVRLGRGTYRLTLRASAGSHTRRFRIG